MTRKKLRPIRRNKKGLLPGGKRRRPRNKTWRKGHRSRKGKWTPGKWVYRPGKIPKSKRKHKPRPKPRPKARPKPAAKAPTKRVRKAAPKPRVKKPAARPKKKKAPARRITPARKGWSPERKRRARIVANTTKASVVESDALIRRARSKGVAWDKVNWDRLQGKDLTFAGRTRRLTKMVGRTTTKTASARVLAADRAKFREQRRRAKERGRPGRIMAARARIEEEEQRRFEKMERDLMRN